MRLLDIGLHIGSNDLKFITECFDPQEQFITIQSMSDHCHLMNWQRSHIDVVNQHTWYWLNQQMCDQFYERYKDEFDEFDAFVTFYPPTFAMMWEKWNKPIIMNVPLRYETPFFNDPVRWKQFNDYIKNNKNIIRVVNNKYDKHYVELFTGLDFQYIPPLCEYTRAQYTGKNNDFLYCSKIDEIRNFIRVSNIINKNNYKISWQQVADCRALIYIPYSNTVMSLIEQYQANIPLLFPTKEFLFQLFQQYKGNRGLMGECSFRQVFNLSSGTILPIDFKGIPDPNDYLSDESFQYWSSLSDFYDEENYPYIQHFSSFRELEEMLFSLDFFSISDKMKKYNIKRKQNILNKWEKVFNSIK